MKKFALIGVALAALSASPVMADDASVLPAGVLRLYAVPSYSWANGSYDKDGKYADYTAGNGKFSFFNLGGALEYGVTDWISAAVQWVPGITLSSTVDQKTAFGGKISLGGSFDVFTGAKLLLVGPKSPVQSDTWRFSVAPGVIIPVPGIDIDQQETNFLGGKDITSELAIHAFGYGSRFYLDYVVTPQFFVDLYSEDIFYLPVKGKKSIGYPSASTDDYDYGYKLTFELEPNYTLPFGDDYSVTFGLPVDYVTSPETKKNGAPDGNGAPSSWSLGPNASLFLYKTFIPLEFKAQYSFDFAGKNTQAVNSLIFQVKAYAKF